jgi:hypothetical protein
MLGHTWRLRASNTQNQNITVTVKARYFKFGTDGSLTFSNEQTLVNAASVSATTGTTASSTVDNSVDKFLGMTITASFTAASATDGSGFVNLTLERSTDGGTTWPTQDRGIFVGAEVLVAGDSTNARLRNFTFR